MAVPRRKDEEEYKIEMLPPPPASVIAPHGFPTDPRPKGAPKIFLDAMDVRIKVFCDEQKCAVEPELDEDDLKSYHWVLYQKPSSLAGDEGGSIPWEPVSVIRIVLPPHGPHPNGFTDPDEEPYVKLGRVATIKHARGKGLNKRLCEEAFRWLSENAEVVGHGFNGSMLTHAQVYVEGVYKKLGFVTDEKLGRWDEEGIEHLGMWNRVELKK